MMQQPFGRQSAQFELAELRNVFIPDTQDRRFAVILNEHRCPILGRRGAGKSALAFLLEYQVPRHFAESVRIELSAIFSQVVNEIERSVAKERTLIDDVARIWTVTLWTAVMHRLVEQNHLRSRFVTTFLSASKEPAAGVGVQLVLDALAGLVRKDGGSLLDWARLRTTLEEFSYSRAVSDTKECLAMMGRDVVLIIDSFDDVPLKTDCQASATIGLLTAANSELHKNLAIKCFLPTEVWVHLRAKMPNVGHFDPFEMRWTPDDLIRLLACRYNWYLAEREMNLATSHGSVNWASANEVRVKVWQKLFPSYAQAPGSPFLESPERLILRHTQLRPRQAIVLCNSVASAWRPIPIPTRPSQEPHWQANAFKPQHLTTGIQDKLESLGTEIVAAYAHINDNVEDALRYFSGGDAVKRHAAIDAPQAAWALAYRVGAIAPVRGTIGSLSRSFDYYQGAEFEFCHREPVEWTPTDEDVAVHPIFHKRLGNTEGLNSVVCMRGYWDQQPPPVEGRWSAV